MPGWRKASASVNNGACVEVTWRKATRCDGGTQGECVEVAFAGDILIRDSKRPEDGHLTVTPAAWQAFTDQLKSGA